MKRGTNKFLITVSVLLLAFSVFVTPFLAIEKVYAQNGDYWTTLEPMPTARSGHVVAVVDGMIYAIGGSDGIYLNCTEEYNTETDTWAVKAEIPTARSEMGAVTYQDKIYVIGGWGNSGITRANEVYDTSSNTWETKHSMPTARTNLVANEVNEKIYIMVGKNFTSYSWPILCNQTEIYDPSTDSWTTGAEIPDFIGIGPEIASKSENVASAVIDNEIYIIVEQTLHIYDTEADNWSYGAELPVYINGPAVCATTGTFAPKRLHVVGSNVHYVYNPEIDEWTSVTSVPNSRYWVELAVINDTIYAIGGGNEEGEYGYQVLNTNEKYTPSGYIPEFPSWLILPLLIAGTLVGVIIRNNIRKNELE